MGFARSWDDLKSKMNNNDNQLIELETVRRIIGKTGIIYSAFILPEDLRNIVILKIRFKSLWGIAEYNYNPTDNSIIVLGDYQCIGIMYKKQRGT